MQSIYNTDADLYEPLLAYYSAPAGRLLLDSFRRIKSLQQFLQDHHAEKYFPGDQSFIKSVDTPDEALAIRNLIMGTRKTHNT